MNTIQYVKVVLNQRFTVNNMVKQHYDIIKNQNYSEEKKYLYDIDKVLLNQGLRSIIW